MTLTHDTLAMFDSGFYFNDCRKCHGVTVTNLGTGSWGHLGKDCGAELTGQDPVKATKDNQKRIIHFHHMMNHRRENLRRMSK